MITRGGAAVGCAHCTRAGAATSCRVCARIVCDACAVDWTTCAEPAGRAVRLGMGARLRDVDPAARIGLVETMLGTHRLFDLRRLRWLAGHALDAISPDLVPRALATNHMVCQRLRTSNSSSASVHDVMSTLHLESREELRIEATPEPDGNVIVGASDHTYYISNADCVIAISPVESASLHPGFVALALGGQTAAMTFVVNRFAPLPRKVLQAVHLDRERSLLISATWGEIALHRIIGETILPTAHVATQDNAQWVAAAGSWVAASVGHVVTVWRLEADLRLGAVRARHDVGERMTAASLSRDGRYLAMAFRRRVILHDLERDTIVDLEGHTDDVRLVRFAANDHLLVTADDDNRVILRPRGATGYARVTIAVDVRVEPNTYELAGAR